MGRVLHNWDLATKKMLLSKAYEALPDGGALIGELRLGASAPMAEGLLPAVLNRLQRDHPLLTIDITQTNTGPALYRELRDRNVDIIVGRMNLPIDDDLAAEVLFDDPLLVVAGPGNPLLRRRKLDLRQLMDEPWILPQASAARTVIEETFAACQLGLPRANVVSNSFTLYEAMLASGPLLAMWPASMLFWGVFELATPTDVKSDPIKDSVVPQMTEQKRFAAKLITSGIRPPRSFNLDPASERSNSGRSRRP